MVRLDSWDETRATKWTLFILGGDFLVGAMAWMTKRPEKKMVVRFNSGAETRATISCWEVAGMPPSEDPLVTTKRTCLMGDNCRGVCMASEAMALMTWRTGFPLRIGNMSHGRQLPGGGRGATRRVHLGGVDGLGGQGQRGSQMLPAGRGLGGLDPGVGCGVKQGAASILDVGQNRYQALGIASNWGRSQSHQLVDDSLDGELEYLGQGQATDAHCKLLVQDLVEMGMRMYKRCREGDVEPRKKKEGVEDGDGEEEVVPVQFVGIDGQKDDGKK